MPYIGAETAFTKPGGMQPYTRTIGGGTGGTLQNLTAAFTAQANQAKAANLQRYNQAMAIYDEIINRYQPGGAFETSALSMLEGTKKRDVASGAQKLVSSGLYGTTRAAGLGTAWEQEVGAPSRLKLEDLMMERLSGAQLGKAGFMERREDEYPDPGMFAQLAGGLGEAGGGGYQQPSYQPSSRPAISGGLGYTPGGVTPATSVSGRGPGPGALAQRQAGMEGTAQIPSGTMPTTYTPGGTTAQPTTIGGTVGDPAAQKQLATYQNLYQKHIKQIQAGGYSSFEDYMTRIGGRATSIWNRAKGL